MRWSWKIAVPVVSAVVICGAAAAWQAHRARANGRLVEDAEVSRVSAEQGDAKAEIRLGNMYYDGQGVPQDYAEALRWYRKAADQGDARAQFDIGSIYYYGRGVTQDYAAALDWYRKAADQGYANAQGGLGVMYSEGLGVPQDYAEAVRWYRKAVDQGYAKAKYNLGNMYFYGRGVSQDRAEADRWYRKAADQGDEYAQRALGLRGRGLSAWGAISFAAVFLWSLLILKDLQSRGQGVLNSQRRAVILCGLSGGVVVGLRLYRAFGMYHSVFAANAFYFIEFLFVGIWIASATSVLSPKGAKFALAISGVLLVGINLLMIVVIARHNLWSFAPITRGFFPLDGLLLGCSISAAVFQRLTHKRLGEDISPAS